MSKPLTIQDLLNNKTLKRTDQGMMVKLEDIHFREGFNPRDEDQRLLDSIEEDAKFTLANGIKDMPQLKVEPRQEGGVWAVDGHRRPRIVRRAIELGADLADKRDGFVWLPVKPFRGNATDRSIETLTSQRQLGLKPIEIMRKIRELAAGVEGEPPLTPTEIATRTGFQRQYIDSLLTLDKAPDDVHQMVRDGHVTADIASTIVRTHGENSHAVLQEELKKAQAMGKKKITRGTMAAASLPKAVANDVAERVQAVVAAIPAESLDILEQYRTEKIKDGDTPVTLPVRQLLALVMVSGHIGDVKAEQQAKADKKADKKAKAEQEQA